VHKWAVKHAGLGFGHPTLEGEESKIIKMKKNNIKKYILSSHLPINRLYPSNQLVVTSKELQVTPSKNNLDCQNFINVPVIIILV